MLYAVDKNIVYRYYCIQKKTDDINKDIAEDVEKRFGTSKLWIRMPILVKGHLN